MKHCILREHGVPMEHCVPREHVIPWSTVSPRSSVSPGRMASHGAWCPQGTRRPREHGFSNPRGACAPMSLVGLGGESSWHVPSFFNQSPGGAGRAGCSHCLGILPVDRTWLSFGPRGPLEVGEGRPWWGTAGQGEPLSSLPTVARAMQGLPPNTVPVCPEMSAAPTCPPSSAAERGGAAPVIGVWAENQPPHFESLERLLSGGGGGLARRGLGVAVGWLARKGDRELRPRAG